MRWQAFIIRGGVSIIHAWSKAIGRGLPFIHEIHLSRISPIHWLFLARSSPCIRPAGITFHVFDTPTWLTSLKLNACLSGWESWLTAEEEAVGVLERVLLKAAPRRSPTRV